MDLDQIILGIERFSEEISKEYYLQGAGKSAEVNFDKIYVKYPGLFSKNNLQKIKDELQRSSPDSEDHRRLKKLYEAFYGGIVSELNKDLNTEFLNSEAGSKIEILPGKRVPYRSSVMYMFNEASREKREIAGSAIESFVSKSLNPILEQMYEKEQVYIKASGFTNKVDMFCTLSGIDIYEIDDIMQNFLMQTEDIYTKHLGKLSNKKLGLPIAELRRHDLMHLMRDAEYDGLFPKDQMLNKISGFVETMGIDISAGGNIKFDLDARENKSPRAFCSPVKIPEEVYLVIYPRGGEEDYTAFLHELGHARHFANVNCNLGFEYKWCGDNSVTEGYAMTFDHFTMNELWMTRYIGVNRETCKEYFEHKGLNELIMLRRHAAKVHYEIKLNETGGLNSKKNLYADIFEKATKVKHSPEYYLLDVDQYFYCARYLRAWMLQANFHEYF